VPYVAGPSLLASQMLLMSREPDRWGEWLAAITLAWLGTALTILLANRLSTYLGRRGLIALERLTGMILVAVAVQMFLNGIKDYMKELP
jgi:small neutral amino acid transporter SnatA (MarC family)